MWANSSVIYRFIPLFFIILLASCGGGSTPNNNVDPVNTGSTPNNNVDPVNTGLTLTGIEITSNSPNKQLTTNSSTTKLDVIAKFSDGSTKKITSEVNWQSDNLDTATVNDTGTVSTHAYVDGVIITANYQTLESSITFTVNPSPDASLDKLIFAPGTDLGTLKKADKITVEVNYSDASIKKNMDFTIDNISYNDAGNTIFDVSNARAKFKAVVNATDTATSTVSAEVTLVEILATIKTITITASIDTLEAGSSLIATTEAGIPLTITAEAIYTDDATADITGQVNWASDNRASLRYFPATKTFRAMSTEGIANISASLDGVTSNILPITVTIPVNNDTPPPATAVTLSRIGISQHPQELALGSTISFSALGQYSNSSTILITGDVNWTSSDTTILDSPSNNHRFIAKSLGTVTVTASLDAIITTTSITVIAAPVVDVILQALVLSPGSKKIQKGQSQTYTLAGKYSDAPNVSVPISSGVVWRFKDNTTGMYTDNSSSTFNMNTAGDYTIEATYNGKTASSPLTVEAVTLISRRVDPANPSIKEGDTQAFKLYERINNDPTTDILVTDVIQWTLIDSTNNLLVSNENGSFTVSQAGVYTVKATYKNEPTNATLRVESSTATDITILIDDTNLFSNTTNNNIRVILKYIDGSENNVTSQIRWEVDNPQLLSVTGENIKTNSLLGKTRIVANLDTLGLSAAIEISVNVLNTAVIDRIEMTDITLSMLTNQQYTLQVKAIYIDGVKPESESILASGLTWQSKDINTATVDSNGLVSSQMISNSVLIVVSYTDPLLNKVHTASLTINVQDPNSFDFMRLQLNQGTTLDKTYIEDNSDYIPTIKAFNNPVGLLEEFQIRQPYAGLYITLVDPQSNTQFSLAIQTPSIGTFDKSQTNAIYRSSSGEYYYLDDSNATKLSISLNEVGLFAEPTKGDFSTTLCKQSIVEASGDCSIEGNQILMSGAFYATTTTDMIYQSFDISNPYPLDNAEPDKFYQISQLTSYFKLPTIEGARYEIRVTSENAAVTIEAFSTLAGRSLLAGSTPSGSTDQVLTFTADSPNSNLDFNYAGGNEGSIFQIQLKALPGSSQGSVTTPLLLNQNGNLFYKLPGQVDSTNSYYQIKVSPNYSYGIMIENDKNDGLSQVILGLSYNTDASSNYTDCQLVSLKFYCKVETNNSEFIYLKVAGQQASGSYSQFKITTEYTPVRDPNNINESLLVSLVDANNLNGQVPYGIPNTVADYNGSDPANFSPGDSVYWISDVKPNTFYKIRLSGLLDNTRMWINAQSGIDSDYDCDAVGGTTAPDVYCIVKTNPSAPGFPISIINSFISGGSIGSTYQLNVSEVNESDLYYFSTFRNNSTTACAPICELLGYSLYLGNNATPFAISITSPNKFHRKLLHLSSGDTVYIRVNDIRALGKAYSVFVGSFFRNTSPGSVENPDIYELNNDNLRENATVLPLNVISDHSLSNNNETFGDVDWLVFTIP